MFYLIKYSLNSLLFKLSNSRLPIDLDIVQRFLYGSFRTITVTHTRLKLRKQQTN